MSKQILHLAASRGHANHGWLDSKHSFSFANYYNPERMHFGVLRVLNDDTVAAGMGFGKHPHDNMEIVTIPLSGDLHHRDSTGRDAIIRATDVQIMSAGSGITHSEVNASSDQSVAFLQIWILPEQENIQPRYQQMTIQRQRRNQWIPLVAPDDPAALLINQQCWMQMLNADAGTATTYHLKNPNNGAYFFVISGSITVSGQILHERDAAGWLATSPLSLQADSTACVLCIEVPF